MHPKRHPIWMEYWMGVDAKGNIQAVKARMIGDTGAYASVGTKVLERAAGHACGPYRTPNVDVEALCVYTNNVPCGAMRGFGVNQAAWAVEQCLDLLAAKVGLDRWTIRYQNALEIGDTFSTGQVLEGGVGLKKTLEAVKDQFFAAKHAGIACGIKNTGIGNGMPDAGEAEAVVEMWDDGAPGIALYSGFTEMGQGLLTIMIQALCEVAPVDPKRVRVLIDTSRPTPCGMTTASRATVLACHAVKLAGEKLAAELAGGASLASLVGRMFRGEWVYDQTVPLGRKVGKDGGPPKTHLAFSYATQVVILDDEGNLEKVIAAHDVGRVVNRTTCEGQIEGSIHMGLGYALTEDCPSENSHLTFKDLRTFGVLRAHHMPPVEVILVEVPDPNGPWGAKGVGEIGLVPTAPAVAGAMRSFDGVLRTKLPMADSWMTERVLKGLAGKD
jgi:xanthine dehydrogenase molybdenum-binding subunit